MLRWPRIAAVLLALGGLIPAARLLGAPGKAAPQPSKDPPPEPLPAAILAEPAFCGYEITPPPPLFAAERPLPCQIPALPCGPSPARKIGGSGVDPNEDLDGDGQPDATLAGIRIGAGAYAYGVIYRGTGMGLVLSDFQRVELPTDPQVAAIAQAMPSGPPLLRDGQDQPLSDGRTLSIARLRRWDGQHFRTLLTFCAHRQAPGPPPREAHNRVTFPDVDGDGTPEIVLSGAIRPVVFRVSGASVREDADLTRRYREDAPEEKKARALRAEAEGHYRNGEWRRAAAALRLARDLSPYVPETRERFATVLLRLGEVNEAVTELQAAVSLAPERGALHCALADALRRADDDDELAALRRCVALGGDPQHRAERAERVAALEAEQRASAPGDGGVADR